MDHDRRPPPDPRTSLGARARVNKPSRSARRRRRLARGAGRGAKRRLPVLTEGFVRVISVVKLLVRAL